MIQLAVSECNLVLVLYRKVKNTLLPNLFSNLKKLETTFFSFLPCLNFQS